MQNAQKGRDPDYDATADNNGTSVVSVAWQHATPPRPLDALFRDHFTAIRTVLNAAPRPGYV